MSRVRVLCLVVMLGACARTAERAPTTTTFPFTLEPPPTVVSVRARLPGYEVWEETRYGESDPGFPIPTICAGRAAGRCEVALSLDAAGALVALTVTDETFEGPRGLRVGASYTSLASALIGCEASFGDEEMIVCGLVGETGVGVVLDGAALHAPGASGAPTAALLTDARVVRFTWHPPTPP